MLNYIWSKIKLKILIISSNTFLKNILFISGGTIFAQFLILSFSPIISRIYSTEDFGIFQQYQAIISFLLVISGLRYEMAIMIPEEKKNAYSLLILSLLINITFSILIFILITIFYFSGYSFRFFNIPIKLLYFVPFAVIGASLYQSLNVMIIREKEYKKIGITKITQSTGLVLGQVFVGNISDKSYGLIWGDLISKFLGISTFFSILIKNNKHYFYRLNWSRLKSLSYEYRKFPFLSVPSGLINVAGLTISTFLIGNYFGLSILGYYALVDRIFAAPSMLIGQSISQVYMGDFVEMSYTNPDALLLRFKNIIKKIGFFAILPYSTAAILAPYVFSWVFGNNWSEAGIYFALLAPMQYISIIVWPLIPTLNLLERQNWQLAWDIIRLLLVISILSLAHYLKLSARISIFYYGVTMIIAYILHLGLSYLAIKTRIKQFRETTKNDF